MTDSSIKSFIWFVDLNILSLIDLNNVAACYNLCKVKQNQWTEFTLPQDDRQFGLWYLPTVCKVCVMLSSDVYITIEHLTSMFRVTVLFFYEFCFSLALKWPLKHVLMLNVRMINVDTSGCAVWFGLLCQAEEDISHFDFHWVTNWSCFESEHYLWG